MKPKQITTYDATDPLVLKALEEWPNYEPKQLEEGWRQVVRVGDWRQCLVAKCGCCNNLPLSALPQTYPNDWIVGAEDVGQECEGLTHTDDPALSKWVRGTLRKDEYGDLFHVVVPAGYRFRCTAFRPIQPAEEPTAPAPKPGDMRSRDSMVPEHFNKIPRHEPVCWMCRKNPERKDGRYYDWRIDYWGGNEMDYYYLPADTPELPPSERRNWWEEKPASETVAGLFEGITVDAPDAREVAEVAEMPRLSSPAPWATGRPLEYGVVMTDKEAEILKNHYRTYIKSNHVLIAERANTWSTSEIIRACAEIDSASFRIAVLESALVAAKEKP